MTMTSGSVGMTRIMLVNRFNASSLMPPMNAPPMPISNDSTVAMPPATKPISRVGPVAAITWESTFWPSWVVPSQYLADGRPRTSGPRALGLWMKSGPKTANSTKNNRMTRPMNMRGERRNAAAAPRSRVATPFLGRGWRAPADGAATAVVTGPASCAGR